MIEVLLYILSVLLAPHQYIHLTFDDGPRLGRTDKVLDVLKKHNVTATFFVVGRQLESKSGKVLLKRIYNEGHVVGIHGYDHISMSKLSFHNQKREITRSIKMIKSIIPTWVPTVYRPPNGVRRRGIEQYLLWRGIKTVMWDSTSNDVNCNNNRDTCRNPVMSGSININTWLFHGGSGILLMHDIYKYTSDVVDQLLTSIEDWNHIATVENDTYIIVIGGY